MRRSSIELLQKLKIVSHFLASVTFAFISLPPPLSSFDYRVMDEYDYVIVGGGTAGLALASRLSQDPSVSVAVLESGFHNASASVDIPGLMGSEMGKESDWNYSAVSSSYGDKGMPWPRGKVLVSRKGLDSTFD